MMVMMWRCTVMGNGDDNGNERIGSKKWLSLYNVLLVSKLYYSPIKKKKKFFYGVSVFWDFNAEITLNIKLSGA